MKRILIVVLLMLTFNLIDNVNASTTMLKKEKIDNVYYERTHGFNNNFTQFENYTLNNTVVYCIEPGVLFSTYHYYTSDDLDISGLSKEKQDKLFLYAYYGYNYINHNSQEYRTATQLLIWEEIGTYQFTFYDQYDRSSNILTYEKEKSEINELVNNHYIVPSFADIEITLIEGQKLKLVDENNVLENFNIINDENIYIEGNELEISYKESGTYDLVYSKTSVNNDSKLIYYNGDTQKMISAGKVDDVTFNIKVNVVETEVNIYKTGEDYINNQYIEKNLNGVEFNIYASEDIYNSNNELLYSKNEIVKNAVTDIDGEISVKNLEFGKYYIKEIKTEEGYKVNNETIYFELNKDNLIYEVTVKNELKKGDLLFTKIDSITAEKIPNVDISIYDDEDILIYSGTTDEYGNISLTNLKEGNYYIIEDKSAEGYILNNEKIYFQINDNETTEVIYTNDKIIEIPDTFLNSNIKIVITVIILISTILIIKILPKKRRKYMAILFILTFVIVSCIFLNYNKDEKIIDTFRYNISKSISYFKINNSNEIMEIKIPSINLEQNIYDFDSPENDVDKNIELIYPSSMPDVKYGTVILAGHSGNSSASYFNDLYKLNIGDIVYLYYSDNEYIYKLENIEEIEKNGEYQYNKDNLEDSLILITCKNNTNKQLVYHLTKQ